MERQGVTKTSQTDPNRRSQRSAQSTLSTAVPLHPVLQLQQTVGNQAVGRFIQAKLAIGQPGDRYEQEADRVAEQVMRMPDPEAGTAISRRRPGNGVRRTRVAGHGSPALQQDLVEDEEEELVQSKPIAEQVTPLVQHESAEESEEKEEEEVIQAKPIAEQVTPLVQRQEVEETEEEEEEEEQIQTKPLSGQTTPTVQRQVEEEEEAAEEEEAEILQTKEVTGQTPGVSPELASRIQALREGGQPLSASTRAFFEPRLSHDFSQVRVHADSRAAETAQAVNARAFTLGRDIVFGAEQYAPGTTAGKRLLAHELTHVAQQGMAEPDGEGLIQRQEGFTAEGFPGFTPQEVEEFGEEDGDLEEDTGEAARKALGDRPGAPVRKAGRISREQYLRQVRDPKKGPNVTATLQFNDSVFVEERGGAKNEWYKIVTAKGQQGWVPAASVALDPPEPKAELYRVKSADTALNLAGRWYGPPGGWKRWWWPGSDDAGDARFYVGALAFANKGRAGMPSPADLTKRDAWMSVKVIKGLTIWKPGKEFLKSLKGKVSSGSITKELWEDAKKAAKVVWGWIVFAAAFISGLLYGALESLYDLFAGAVELVKMVWKVGKSLLTGNFITDAKDLWNSITNLDVSALADDFQKKWTADDPWDSGFFRGRVVGYVIMEIVMLVFSGGILSAIKWTGKFAKIGALIAKIPKIAKVAEVAAKGAKIPAKAGKWLKARYAGKLGKAGAKILKGVEKGKVAIETYLKSVEHLRKRAAAYKKYLARGGKKSKAAYNKIYDTLTRNRMVGKLAEEQFQLVMKGSPKSYRVTVAGKKVLRKVDNVLGNVAREVKSGPLKLTPFIRKQILKDMELIRAVGLKVEWHLLAGGDAKAIAALKKAGIDVIIY